MTGADWLTKSRDSICSEGSAKHNIGEIFRSLYTHKGGGGVKGWLKWASHLYLLVSELPFFPYIVGLRIFVADVVSSGKGICQFFYESQWTGNDNINDFRILLLTAQSFRTAPTMMFYSEFNQWRCRLGLYVHVM